MVKGTGRTELITAHMVDLGNNRFRCNYCEFISHNRVNTFAHIGYIHLSSPCEACGNMCFQTCFMQEEADSPTSTESPLVVLSSFIHFLGEFFPRTAIETELDYIVKISNGEI